MSTKNRTFHPTMALRAPSKPTSSAQSHSQASAGVAKTTPASAKQLCSSRSRDSDIESAHRKLLVVLCHVGITTTRRSSHKLYDALGTNPPSDGALTLGGLDRSECRPHRPSSRFSDKRPPSIGRILPRLCDAAFGAVNRRFFFFGGRLRD